jgi:hypothetical protein
LAPALPVNPLARPDLLLDDPLTSELALLSKLESLTANLKNGPMIRGPQRGLTSVAMSTGQGKMKKKIGR